MESATSERPYRPTSARYELAPGMFPELGPWGQLILETLRQAALTCVTMGFFPYESPALRLLTGLAQLLDFIASRTARRHAKEVQATRNGGG